MAQELKELMTQFKDEMRESMKTIATETISEILKTSDSRLTRTTEKLERERKADQITFNKKGHEDQFIHGNEIEEKIDYALELSLIHI